MVATRFFVLGTVCICLAGCSSDNGDRPTAPVKVTVSYKGKPVENAIVQFITVESPQPAVGTTDASGNCSLTTYKTNDGAIIGSNKVTVLKNDIDKTNIRPVRPEDADLVGVTPAPILKSLIPKKYSDPDKSGLVEEVKKGQNTFTFELKD